MPERHSTSSTSSTSSTLGVAIIGGGETTSMVRVHTILLSLLRMYNYIYVQCVSKKCLIYLGG